MQSTNSGLLPNGGEGGRRVKYSMRGVRRWRGLAEGVRCLEKVCACIICHTHTHTPTLSHRREHVCVAQGWDSCVAPPRPPRPPHNPSLSSPAKQPRALPNFPACLLFALFSLLFPSPASETLARHACTPAPAAGLTVWLTGRLAGCLVH